jgi:hypothetical protein
MSEVPVSAGGRKPPALMRSCSQASDGSQIDSLQPEYDAAALMGDEPPHRHRPSVVAEIQAGAGPRRDPLSSRQPQTGTIPTPKRRSMEARSVPHPLTLDLLPVSNTIQHKVPVSPSPKKNLRLLHITEFFATLLGMLAFTVYASTVMT